MTVKELIEILKKCNQEARVKKECWHEGDMDGSGWYFEESVCSVRHDGTRDKPTLVL